MPKATSSKPPPADVLKAALAEAKEIIVEQQKTIQSLRARIAELETKKTQMGIILGKRRGY